MLRKPLCSLCTLSVLCVPVPWRKEPFKMSLLHRLNFIFKLHFCIVKFKHHIINY